MSVPCPAAEARSWAASQPSLRSERVAMSNLCWQGWFGTTAQGEDSNPTITPWMAKAIGGRR